MLKEETEAAPGRRPRAARPTPELPAEPLIKIRPGAPGAAAELRAAWAHREVLYHLVLRDLKVRYRQTALGVLWVVLHPLLMALVFAVFMGRLARVPSDGLPYPLFAYAGLLPWTFFSNSASVGAYSLIANSHLITRVYFPRVLVPAAAAGVRLVDFLVTSVVLFAMMAYYGVGVGRGLLMLPPLMALAALLSAAVSVWSSALVVKYRDVGTLLPVLLQVWMFASPVIYPPGLVPEPWRLAYSLNPMVGIIGGFRSALFGSGFDWAGISVSAAVTLALAAYSVRAFHAVEERLADIV